MAEFIKRASPTYQGWHDLVYVEPVKPAGMLAMLLVETHADRDSAASVGTTVERDLGTGTRVRRRGVGGAA